MYTFFERRTTGNKARWKAPMWSYIDNVIEENAKKVIQFYRNFPLFMNSTHVLSKLVDNLPLCKDGDLPSHISRIEKIAEQQTRTHEFTSPLSKGKIHTDGIMFRPGTKEIVICINELFDVFTINQYWKEACPITFLYHESTDLSIPFLHGKGSRYTGEIEDVGYAVIMLDIPLLAAQYECWRLWNNSLPAGQRHTIQQFLMSYPLVNAVRSFTDIAVFNRLKCITRGEIIEPYVKSHPFPLTPIEGRVDNVLRAFKVVFERSTLDFQNMLLSIPEPFDANAWELFKLPDVANTRQIEWAMNISRMAVINWLLDYGNKGMNAMNLNWFRRRIRDLKADNIFNALPPLDQLSIRRYIDNIYKKCER